jgi:hypothetical protein
MDRRCESPTKSGEPCKGRPLDGDSRCLAHSDSPAAIAAREAGRRAGGEQRAKQLYAANTSSDEQDGGDDEENNELLDLIDVEFAQRQVALDLLGGRLSTRDAMARTRALEALARRIRDVAESKRSRW